VSFAFFGSSQSVSFQCRYETVVWDTLGSIYWSSVHNKLNITSLDAAQINDISGTHEAGKNNDNVEGLWVIYNQIHYFPRGLNKFFKNLKAIRIYYSGLKAIHQSDLKDFPKLVYLSLDSNNLEILEENLFEFNPNLEEISLHFNQISHIDSKVFEKLTKLTTLWLSLNTCIDMFASNNATAVRKIIKTAQSQCTNTDYSNLEQKVANLRI
jgi:Leucine-rich repeat (LRR) protein